MPVKVPTQEQMATISNRVLQEQVERAKNRPPDVLVNAAAARDLGSTQRLEFKGKRYDVPPVPYKLGIELQQVLFQLRAIEKEKSESAATNALRECMTTAVRLFPRLVVPVGAFRRLRWKLGLVRNPFEEASEGEIGRLIRLFYTCRTKSTIRSARHDQANPSEST